MLETKKKKKNSKLFGHKKFYRRRRQAIEVMNMMSPQEIRGALRFTEKSFWKLHNLLFHNQKYSDRKRGISVNGNISNATKLYVALRMFAGASVHDLGPIFGIHKSVVY